MQGLALFAGLITAATTSQMQVVQAQDWTGFFVGAHLDSGTTLHRFRAPAQDLALKGLGANGLGGGLHAGFDVQLGAIVTGAEIEVDADGRKATLTSPLASGSLKRTRGVGISLRGGILPSEHTLLYVRGGYVLGRHEGELRTTLGAEEVGKDLDGYHVGAGMETRITPNTSLRLEYRHTRYREKDIGTAAMPVALRPTDHSMRLGVTWRFDDASSDGSRRAARGWTGPFAGVRLAAAGHATEVRTTDGSLDGIGGDGALAGAYAGYDYQLGPRAVIGAEAGAAWSSVKSHAALAGRTASIRLRHAFDVSARIGWLVQPETLVYLRGGLMRAGIRSSLDAARNDFDKTGFLAGIGMETQLLESVNLRLEYRHVRLDGEEWDNATLSPSLNSGSIGLSMRF